MDGGRGRPSKPTRSAPLGEPQAKRRGVLPRTHIVALGLGPAGGRNGDSRHRWSAPLSGGLTKAALK
ncbi:hypothetical protein NDU88_012952 [Pleurodeles waltl]|uniref:Uncharacterized protein n=1 Tax=Pleurodeles waltl TaxID=8319 RepID=A0AAV7R647_PLEWA|nr:hypothetical protein NDU88_012952 [Pleurodeles waltl]